MNNKMQIFALSIILGLAAACTTAGIPGPSPSPSAVVATETLKDINVTAGSEFTLKLDSNITTGYKWDLKNEPDARIVSKVSSVYVPPENQVPGAGGYELWKFKALAKGNTDIMMKYFRPWEKDAAPVKEVTFTVKVN